MKKLIITYISAMLLSILFAFPVLADNYTGWSLEQDKVVYYIDGIKQTNVWILKGETLHYIGADGLLDNTQAADISAAPALGITNYIVDKKDVKYDVPLKQDAGDIFSAAKYAFNVKDDFEAFVYLYPQYKVTLSPDALYDYYLSSYHNGDTPNKYLQALDGYVNTYTNMCTYGYSYSPNHDGTHKNYCACGKYIIENCTCHNWEPKKNFTCKYCHTYFNYENHKKNKD